MGNLALRCRGSLQAHGYFRAATQWQLELHRFEDLVCNVSLTADTKKKHHLIKM